MRVPASILRRHRLDGCVSLQIPEIEAGFDIRKRIFNLMDVPLPTAPTHDVLLWLRPNGHPRYILNWQAMEKIVRSYRLNCT
jgi:hypothetical protein